MSGGAGDSGDVDAASRFSGRARDYASARPSYPAAVLTLLFEECGLDASSVVADLGSGTGIFTRLLLESGAAVHAVEPNDDMRTVAEADLVGWPGFRSVKGRAEATTLESASVDLVTAAQAFHWFDLEGARAEMKRILKPGGKVALVYNDRDLGSTAFLREYEALLLARCPKYRELQGKADATERFDALFGAGRWTRHALPNAQRLDREGLVARLFSSSYAPAEGAPEREAARAELQTMFDRHAEDGAVVMVYTTVVILGELA